MTTGEKLANGFTLEQEVMLCELYWPGLLTSKRTSKARRNLRKRAADKCLTDYLLSQGRVCGNCRHRRGKVCELHSDFYGTQTIRNKETETCLTHTA
jgi:hypothetical protein